MPTNNNAHPLKLRIWNIDRRGERVFPEILFAKEHTKELEKHFNKEWPGRAFRLECYDFISCIIDIHNNQLRIKINKDGELEQYIHKDIIRHYSHQYEQELKEQGGTIGYMAIYQHNTIRTICSYYKKMNQDIPVKYYYPPTLNLRYDTTPKNWIPVEDIYHFVKNDAVESCYNNPPYSGNYLIISNWDHMTWFITGEKYATI